MTQRLTISISDYAYERIMNAKPKNRNTSEWTEELMLRQLDILAVQQPPVQIARTSTVAQKRNREDSNAPARISTLDTLSDGTRVSVVLMRSGGVPVLHVRPVAESEPWVCGELMMDEP